MPTALVTGRRMQRSRSESAGARTEFTAASPPGGATGINSDNRKATSKEPPQGHVSLSQSDGEGLDQGQRSDASDGGGSARVGVGVVPVDANTGNRGPDVSSAAPGSTVHAMTIPLAGGLARVVMADDGSHDSSSGISFGDGGTSSDDEFAGDGIVWA